MPSLPTGGQVAATDLSASLAQPEGWKLIELEGAPAIEKSWRFADFHQTMTFANAVAGVAHKMDHHPDMTVSYNRCTVRYTTHDAGGLTQRDLDAATRIDGLPEGFAAP